MRPVARRRPLTLVLCCSGGVPYSNVMHDKRVVRGSTFAAHPSAAVSTLRSCLSSSSDGRRW